MYTGVNKKHAGMESIQLFVQLICTCVCLILFNSVIVSSSYVSWMDATLRELCELVQQVNESSRSPRASLSFAFVYPDRHGVNVIKHVQTIPSFSNARNSTKQNLIDENKTLKQLGFETGDFLDIAIIQQAKQ